jgi:transposase
MGATADLKRKFSLLRPSLNERTRRLFAAAEALTLGVGLVARATKVSRTTIYRGLGELRDRRNASPDRVRRPGGGRKKTVEKDATLKADLEAMVDPVTRGDPESPLRWTCKSVRNLALELTARGHSTSRRMVAAMLHEMGYSLQANRKTKEGSKHPDRNAQFEHIRRTVEVQQARSQPVISVDTKKKELVGEFKNAGREWRPKERPVKVRMHDFLIRAKGKAIPYGVFDLSRNAGWVSVGIDHDTASFAVNAIRSWWRTMGSTAYPRARALLITADCGGSNGAKNRLWKWELQRMADRTGLEIRVCHFPPGTSKWNKIEHRLFSFIGQNWRGQPLLSRAAIVNLISATKTTTGLIVRCQLDTRRYPEGRQITDQQMKEINLRPNPFHGEWNYTIRPRRGRLL